MRNKSSDSGLNPLPFDCHPIISSFTCRMQSDCDITVYLEPQLFELNTDYIIEPTALPLGQKFTYRMIRNHNYEMVKISVRVLSQQPSVAAMEIYQCTNQHLFKFGVKILTFPFSPMMDRILVIKKIFIGAWLNACICSEKFALSSRIYVLPRVAEVIHYK